MKNLSRLIVTGIVAASIQGCYAKVMVEADPEDARVFVDGVDLGKAPVELPGGQYGNKRHTRLVLKKRGYLPVQTTLENDFDAWALTRGLLGSILLGSALASPYFVFPRRDLEPFLYAGAGVLAAGGVRTWLTSYAFQERYWFEMTKDPSDAGDTARVPAVAGPASIPHAQLGSPPAELVTDVDEAIASNASNPRGVAVVIGIERYNPQVPSVRFARRDAMTFSTYLTRTLGIPPERIITLYDERATAASIETALEGQLKTMVEPGASDVYLFYAGHGAPDVKTKTPYLVPHDGQPQYPTTSCYPMKRAYAALGALRARSVTVVLDACFSGGTGRAESPSETLVANARPMFIEPTVEHLPPGVVVFAGATGQQISSGFEPKQHGLFTYYFLKGLRGDADLNADRQITPREMQRYLEPWVGREARRLNREQTPVLLGDAQDRVLLRF